MKPDVKNIEDLLLNESFRSWVNTPTPELDSFWKEWIRINKDKEELVQQAILAIKSLNFQEFQADQLTKRRIYNRINVELNSSNGIRSFKNYWQSIAAVFAFLITVGSLLYFVLEGDLNSKSNLLDSQYVLKENTIGVKSEHILSDGTRISLNSNSSIEYPATFSSENRVVRLKGEAYFDVSYDSLRPFIVETNDFEIQVLGTEFNANTKSQNVALVEGKVKLTNQNSSIVLSPGEMVKIDSSSNSFSSSTFDIRYITGWKDGYLVFQDASFKEVVERLNEWYGIKISVSKYPETSQWSYTASFRNESLESVLANMRTLRRFEYKIENDSLKLSF